MGKNRANHDPEASLPESMHEELKEQEQRDGGDGGDDRNFARLRAGRKDLRKKKKLEKKQKRIEAVASWQERRGSALRKKDQVVAVPVQKAADEKKQKAKSKKTKRKRETTETAEIEDEAVEELDRDKLEEERLAKLLYSSSKRQKNRGKYFDWDLEFAGDDDEDGLKYLLEGLNVLKKTLKKAKEKGNMVEEEPEDDDCSDGNEKEDEEISYEEEEEDRELLEAMMDEEASSDGQDELENLQGKLEVDEDTKDVEGAESDEDSGEDEDASLEDSEEGKHTDSELDQGNVEELDNIDESESDQQKPSEVKGSRTGTTKREASSLAAMAKYVPPSQRKAESKMDPAAMRRRIRGTLNRLSDENAEKMAKEMLSFAESSLDEGANRGDLVQSFQTEILSCVKEGSGIGRINPFIPAIGGIVIYMHRVSNDEFGATILASSVQQWDAAVKEKDRSAFGLQNLLLVLYEGRLFQSSLLYDMIRRLVEHLDEFSVEMLLLLVRSAGPAMRRNDPTVLKEIIIFVKDAEKRRQEDTEESSSERFRILLELLFDVKNHKLSDKKTMRDILPWMKNILDDVMPLKATLEELLDEDFIRCKLWRPERRNPKNETELKEKLVQSGATVSTRKVSAIAARQGLNTDFRRSLFTAIMTSADVKEASQRLSKFTQKKKEASDCARVIIHCCSHEKAYNKFYALLVKRLCSEQREMTHAMQHALREAFRLMMEDSASSEGFLSARYVNNVSQLLGYLWGNGVLDMAVLKAAPELSKCEGKVATFFRLSFEHAFLSDARSSMDKAFSALAQGEGFKDPDSIRLPLIYFLRKNVLEAANARAETKAKTKTALRLLKGT